VKLVKMTATFGCLDQAVLEPKDGLNVITLPNESGKSTWAAFLTAMFYGIDTTQRAAKGRLPEKTRYQPWSGKPMAGTLEIEDRGRILVLQRTSERGKPLGLFRAWDRETGLDVPELTGDNCGRRLLGVERAVFQRSAFLSGADLTVSQDQDLARRLGALAASGQENDSYPQAESRLKLWQNRLRYHKTGLIPETEEQLQSVRELLAEAETLRRRQLEVRAELEQTKTQIAGQTRAREQQVQQEQRQLQEALTRAAAEAQSLGEQTAALPPEEELRRLQGKLEALIPLEDRPEPACPPPLANLAAEAVWPKAQADAAQYETWMTGRLLAMPVVFLLYAAVLLIGGIVCAALKLWAGAAACGGLAVLCLILWVLKRKKDRHVLADRKAAKALLAAYGVKTKEELLNAAVERRDWLLWQQQVQHRDWERDLILERVRDFDPAAETPAQAHKALDRAVDLHRACRSARRALETARLQWETYVPAPSDGTLETLHRRTVRLQTELEGLQRQAEALGSWDALQTRAQTLADKLADLCRREQALTLAREALASANSQLAQVYAPQLTGLAGQYLEQLTAGRYNGLILQQDLALSVRETESGLVRPLAVLSRGAQDQTWLALRLAMTRLLLPKDAPIVLDDALLTFDPAREQAALAVLAKEHRQVLLFSCR